MVYENRVLRRIIACGHKRDDITDRNSYNKKLENTA
jgi:hypothetical protein